MAQRSKPSVTAALLLIAAGVLLAVGVVLLIVQNTEPTTIEWLIWDLTGPTWVVVLLAFGAGALATPAIVAGIAGVRNHRRRLDAQIDGLAHRGVAPSPRRPRQATDAGRGW